MKGWFSFGSKKEAPRTFGLAEAEAAAVYVADASQAQAVVGVVVGVLGYENRLAPDADSALAAQQTLIDNSVSAIEKTQDEIESLRGRIRGLEGRIGRAKGRSGEIENVRRMFSNA